MTLLQLGDYPRGLTEYEWRWKTGQFTPFHCPHPRWDGSLIPGKTLLIHTEQGADDAIQFARYLPLAAERAGKLILVCTPDLSPLFATLPGIAEIREPGSFQVAEFDTYLPLLSLPYVFGSSLETIPNRIPYIDVALLRRRKAMTLPPTPPSFPHPRPPGEGRGEGIDSISDPLTLTLSLGEREFDQESLKVGLVWAGSPAPDPNRSCPLTEFLPLLRFPGIAFYSLQKGERSEDLRQLPLDCPVHDLEATGKDFGDTALWLDQLDLLISVDTSVAHLAGALDKPVWLLLCRVPDWRWGLEGETTPWYPGMRLFRQTRRGDWAGVMARVMPELVAWRGGK